jgi:hypothetical protein
MPSIIPCDVNIIQTHKQSFPFLYLNWISLFFKPSQDLLGSYVWLLDKKLIPLRDSSNFFKNFKKNKVSKDSLNLLLDSVYFIRRLDIQSVKKKGGYRL